jgi:hypothetical protein
MIKRILLTLALVVLPSIAMADTADRDILLTSDGTLFTIESVFTDGLNLKTNSSQVLALTVRDEKSTSTTYVPETLLGGSHGSPALAYDAVSKSLFIFWERGINNRMSSDLVFCSYQNGKWSEATSIDSANYHWSHNIRIGVSRKAELIGEDGKRTSVAQLTVHAAWWEDRGGRMEWARYAMLTIEDGIVSDIQIRDLSAFVDVSRDLPRASDANGSNEILRHPALFESSSHDTVNVVFGDLDTNNMHQITIRPTIDISHMASEGRIHIPVGVHDSGLGGPRFRTEANAKIGAISGGSGKLVFFSYGKDSVSYVSYSDGTWSPERSLAVNEKVTADAAVEVLRKMANAE